MLRATNTASPRTVGTHRFQDRKFHFPQHLLSGICCSRIQGFPAWSLGLSLCGGSRMPQGALRSHRVCVRSCAAPREPAFMLPAFSVAHSPLPCYSFHVVSGIWPHLNLPFWCSLGLQCCPAGLCSPLTSQSTRGLYHSFRVPRA